jgi:hypothetical protein
MTEEDDIERGAQGDETSTRFYIGAGGLAAILLGIALVPLRGLTPASNLAFASWP